MPFQFSLTLEKRNVLNSFVPFCQTANKVNKAAYSDLENGTIKNGDASKKREFTDSKSQQVNFDRSLQSVSNSNNQISFYSEAAFGW